MIAQDPRPGHCICDYPMRLYIDSAAGSLAKTSLGLHHLSIAFKIDARHFFSECKPQWAWQNLQSLALTSELLTSSHAIGNLVQMLQEAAGAVRRMPKLDTLAVWNYKNRKAAAFLYRREKGWAKITWRGTWVIEFTAPLIQAWEKVASASGSLGLLLETSLCGSTLKSLGDAMEYLGLPPGVINPVSVRHMKREAMFSYPR